MSAPTHPEAVAAERPEPLPTRRLGHIPAFEGMRGIAVAIAREMNLPVRFVGVGEKMDDLLEFSAKAFVDSLLD